MAPIFGFTKAKNFSFAKITNLQGESFPLECARSCSRSTALLRTNHQYRRRKNGRDSNQLRAPLDAVINLLGLGLGQPPEQWTLAFFGEKVNVLVKLPEGSEALIDGETGR